MGFGHQAKMIKTLVKSQIRCLATYETLEEVTSALQPRLLNLLDRGEDLTKRCKFVFDFFFLLLYHQASSSHSFKRAVVAPTIM